MEVEGVETETEAQGENPKTPGVSDVSIGQRTFNAALDSNTNAITYSKADPSVNSDYTFTCPAVPTGYVYITTSSGATLSTLGAEDFMITDKKITIRKGAQNVAAGEQVIHIALADGTEGQVRLQVWPNVSYIPTKYYKGSYTDINYTVTDEPTYVTVNQPDEDEKPKGKYNVTSEYASDALPGSYLETLDPGTYNFDFWYNMGTAGWQRLRSVITVAQEYTIDQINDVPVKNGEPSVIWYTNSGKNIEFHIAEGVENFTGVQINGKTVSWEYYNHNKNTGVITLKPGILNSLNIGKGHVVTLLFKDGDAVASLEVKRGSASPKTGDQNNIALWVAVLALSGGAVVALVPKKKKQQ